MTETWFSQLVDSTALFNELLMPSQAGKVLYRLHWSLICRHSGYFMGLFNFTSKSAPPDDKPSLGSTNEDPIVVQDDPRVFDLVVRWMYQELYHRQE